MQSGFETIDEYIRTFPAATQKFLREMRKAIASAAPAATEKISYQIPTFFLNGNLVHFAGYKHHIGFYPGANGISAFKDDLKIYKSAKGSVQFPIGFPLPIGLIKKIVRFRVKENLSKPQKSKKPAGQRG
jgi:uncharacterized protein YdhG (YjbR/CyaY superfamily)